MLWKRTEQVPKRGPLPSRGVTRAILASCVPRTKCPLISCSELLFPHWITAMCVSYRWAGGGHMNKQVMENATTGQQQQFLLGSLPLKWPLVPKQWPSRTWMAKPLKTSCYPPGIRWGKNWGSHPAGVLISSPRAGCLSQSFLSEVFKFKWYFLEFIQITTCFEPLFAVRFQVSLW